MSRNLILVTIILVIVISKQREFLMPSEGEKWSFKVKSSESFSIKIKGNPTTGYLWQILNPSELQSEHSKVHCTNLNINNSTNDYQVENPELLGSPGFYHFNFTSQKVSKDELINITFINKRPWNPLPIRTVETIITLTQK